MTTLRIVICLLATICAAPVTHAFVFDADPQPLLISHFQVSDLSLREALDFLTAKLQREDKIAVTFRCSPVAGKRPVSLSAPDDTPVEFILEVLCDQTGTTFDPKQSGPIVLKDRPVPSANTIDDSTLILRAPITRVNFEHLQLEDALDTLFEMAKQQDHHEFPAAEGKRGVGRPLFLFRSEKRNIPITLSLTNTTLQDAIDPICEKAGLLYRVDGWTVIFEEKPPKALR